MTQATRRILAATICTCAAAGCDALQERLALKNGNHLFSQQRYVEAIAEYRKILTVDPGDWTANYQIAVSYMALYHPGSTHPKDQEYAERAVEAFERCLTLEAPSSTDADKVRDFYLSFLVASNHTSRAVAFLEKRLKAEPGNASLMARLGRMYATAGDFPRALHYFEMRAAAEPAEKEPWYTIGVLCWERSYKGGFTVSNEERAKLVEKGSAALEKALQIDPDYFEALSYVSLIYREKAKMLAALGQAQEADNAYEAADFFLDRALAAKNRRGGTSGAARGV